MRTKLGPGVWLWVFLPTLFLFSRLHQLSNLPLFSDEAYAILQANELYQHEPLLGMVKYTTQPIFIWLIAIFQYLPLPLITSARFVSAIMGLVSAGLLAYLAKKYIHPQSAVLAFIVALSLPFAVFYDRTALFESPLLAAMLIAVVIPPLGMPLAILTKQTGWLILPLVIGLHWRNRRVVIATLATSIIVPLTVWMLALGSLDAIREVMFAKTAASLGTTSNIVPHLYNGLLRVKLWLTSYLTLPLIFLGGFGAGVVIVDGWRQKKISLLLLIATWTTVIIVFESATAVIFYPRYLYPVVIGVVLLVTKALWTIHRKLNHQWLTLLVVGAWLIVPMGRSWTIITKPKSAMIAAEDHFQFYDDWTSGSGSSEIAAAIAKDNGLNSNEASTVYLEEQNSYAVTLLDDLGRSSVSVKIADWLVDPLEEIPSSVLAHPGVGYVIRNRHPDIPTNWPVELVKEIPKSKSRSVYLYRIVKS